MRSLLFLICFMLMTSLSYGFAGKPVKQKAVLKTDTAAVNVRSFNADKLSAYSKQPEFQYKDPITGPSLWTRFWRWVWKLLSAQQNRHQTGRLMYYVFFILKYLFIVAGLGTLAWLIIKLTGTDLFYIFNRRPASGAVDYSELLDNIHEIDFDGEIERTIAAHNYRLAVRLLYLKSLKQLSDAGHINWEPNKTNSAYIYEITNPDERDAFKQLTRQFEYAWYGDFMIDQQAFNGIYALFQRFKKEVA